MSDNADLIPQIRAIEALKNLQASHRIVLSLELAKNKMEEVIENSQDLFLVFTENGQVLKANRAACRTFGFPPEGYLYEGFIGKFEPTYIKLLTTKINYFLNEPGLNGIEFELPIISGENGLELMIHWRLNYLDNRIQNPNRYLTLYGRDITAVRNYEKKLSEIFSIIPIGIMTLNITGHIEENYSKYCEYCLSNSKISGVDNGFANHGIYEVLFEPSKDSIDKLELDLAKQIPACLGEDSSWFESMKPNFPKRIIRHVQDQAITLGISYYPILKGEIVTQLLIIIVNEGEYSKNSGSLMDQELRENEKEVRRILDITKTDRDLIVASYQDFDVYLARGNEALEINDHREFANALHGIKSASRVIGFSIVTSMAHELESYVLAKDPKELNDPHIKQSFVLLRSELAYCRKFCNVLVDKCDIADSKVKSGDARALKDQIFKLIKSYTHKKIFRPIINELQTVLTESDYRALSEMQGHLTTQCNNTAAQLSKKIRLDADWNEIKVTEPIFSVVKEVLTHTLNNAIDHGIEASDKRAERKKSEVGEISIVVTRHDKLLYIVVKDDGGGLSRDAILKKACANGLVSVDAAPTMADSDVWQLIFEHGFSTKSDVSNVSGRGIGLDAVKSVLKKFGNHEIGILSMPGMGLKFTFKILAYD